VPGSNLQLPCYPPIAITGRRSQLNENVDD
jgi:hypothetical protein